LLEIQACSLPNKRIHPQLLKLLFC